MPKCLNDSKRTYKGDEPSPKGLGYCAHAERVGKTREGQDGNTWKVVTVETKNGKTMKRWVKASGTKKSKSSPKKEKLSTPKKTTKKATAKKSSSRAATEKLRTVAKKTTKKTVAKKTASKKPKSSPSKEETRLAKAEKEYNKLHHLYFTEPSSYTPVTLKPRMTLKQQFDVNDKMYEEILAGPRIVKFCENGNAYVFGRLKPLHE